jgi:hypothetical protein
MIHVQKKTIVMGRRIYILQITVSQSLPGRGQIHNSKDQGEGSSKGREGDEVQEITEEGSDYKKPFILHQRQSHWGV